MQAKKHCPSLSDISVLKYHKSRKRVERQIFITAEIGYKELTLALHRAV